MKGILTLVSFCLLSILSLHAQIKLDSLRSIVESDETPSSSRLEAMYTLADHYLAGQPDSARWYAEESLVLAQRTGNQKAEGRAMEIKGTLHLRKGDFAQALQMFQQGLQISQRAGDSLFQGKFLNMMGGTHMSMGELDSSLFYYQQTRTHFESMGDKRGIATAISGLGLVSKSLGDFDQALAYYKQAIEAFEETGSQFAQAMTYRNMAFIHVTRSEYLQGLSYCHQSLKLFETLGDIREIANTLNTIGLTYFYKRDFDSAIVYYHKVLEIQERGQDQLGLANTYNNIGLVYNSIGNYPLAIENYEKSLQIKETLGDKRGIASALINIGTVFNSQKDYQQALMYFQRGLRSFEEIGEQYRIATTYGKLAGTYHVMGNDSLALPLAVKYLEVAQQMGIKDEEASALIQLGGIYHELGLKEKSEDAFQRAIDITQDIEEPLRRAGAWIGLANKALDEQAYRKARDYSQRGLTLAQKAQSISQTRNAASILWESQEALGEEAAAFRSYKLYIQSRDSLSSEENQRAAIRYEFSQKALADSLRNASLLAVEVAENKRRQTTSYFLISGLVLTLLFGLLLFNRFKLTQKQKGIIELEKSKLDRINNELNLANERLQDLDSFKSRFFTNISHEFRTPLTVIGGMMDQISGNERAKSLVKRNTDRLLTLINQILDLRKLESGNLSLQPIQDDVIAFLRYNTESFESLAASKSIRLNFRSEEEEFLMDFDPDKLMKVHTNLISNALKFTPEHGQIEIEVRKEGENFLLSIKDTGKGIPENKLAMIFDRFYQVDHGETRDGEGTGIGLTLTKELLNLMQGEIKAESEVGKGTTFHIRLPITQSAKRASAASMLSHQASLELAPLAAADRPFSTFVDQADLPSLLIIEDNEDIVEYLLTCLEDQYEIITAHDGQAGVEAAFEHIPDLIISDVMMPRKNGYEVCETLKLDERTSHIPIVMLTAKADDASRIEGYKRGADAYLAKPFNQAELFVRLEKLLEIRRTLQARYQGGEIPGPTPTDDPATQQEDAFLLKARQCVMDHLDDSNYRGESLGRDLGMSRSNLHRKIKALTGLSISHFIRIVRIDHAKELMSNPELQVAEIAYMSGFSNPKYFNRVFKQVTGETPTDWRHADQKLS